MGYPCKGGHFEGRRQFALLWLHDLSHLKSGYFVPYLTYTLQNKVLKIAMELDTDIFDSSTVNLDIACYDKPIALSNKKVRRILMEIFRYVAISTKML